MDTKDDFFGRNTRCGPIMTPAKHVLLYTSTCHRVTPVAGLSLTRLAFEKIFKTQGFFKTQKSALLVLWKGVINPPL